MVILICKNCGEVMNIVDEVTTSVTMSINVEKSRTTLLCQLLTYRCPKCGKIIKTAKLKHMEIVYV